MVSSILLIAVGLGFTGYRRNVSLQAQQAHQVGDQVRARQLVSRYAWLTWLWIGLWVVILLLLAVTFVIDKHG